MTLPEFAGNTVAPTQPPFQFSNVMCSTFPLRAQLDSLQRFCDGYLNVVPPEVGYFRAFMPYVMLMLLDYGKLAAQATNYGWFSQREVLFSVPVEWYKRVNGRWVFHDWASISPFIYVDAEMSMSLGRTGMGWPKSLVSLTPQLTGWMRDPSGSTVDLSISARVFANAYAGARMEEQPVMMIRSPAGGSPQLPFHAEDPRMPWNVLASSARAMTGFFSDYLSSLQGMGIFPAHEGSTPENLWRKLQKGASLGAQSIPWGPRLESNSVNLKQFRQAHEPDNFCFQALTNGPMRFTSFNRGGLLGSTPGDPSGGYIVDLACFPSFPVVDALGLDAAFINIDGDPRIARLQPVMPFWYDVNMEYQQTDTLVWRTGSDPVWRDHENEYPDSSSPLFNSITGASSPVVTGPFRFASATITALPLLASSQALQAQLNATFNDPLVGTGEHFALWGDSGEGHAYVYLCAMDAGEVSSETNNIGDWGDLSLAFYIPVLRWSGDTLLGAGLVPMHVFAAGTTHACTLTELYGVPAIEANFSRLAHEWDGFDETDSRGLLSVDAMTLPALNEGEQARVRSLLEFIDRGAGDTVDAPLSHSADTFCRLLRAEVERKTERSTQDHQKIGRRLALEKMGRASPLHVYTMKQFRDSGMSNKACYQALVQIPYVIEEVQQLEEVERLWCVEIRKRASFPIVEDLGLVARDVRNEAGAIVHQLEAVRPFRLKVELSMGNGCELYSRADLDWKPHSAPKRPAARPLLPLEAEQHVSLHSCTFLKRTLAEWLEGHEQIGTPVLQTALQALDPQAIIEGILSLEWEDRSRTSTRAELREALTRAMVRDEAGWGSWLADNLRRLGGLSDVDQTLVHWLHRLELLSLKLDRQHIAVMADGQSGAPMPTRRIWDELTEAERLEPDQQEKLPNLTPLASAREQEQLAALHENWLRKISLYQHEDASKRAAWMPVTQATRELLRALYPLAERRLDHATDEAVRARRKSDHCVLRSTAGSERDRLFPTSQSRGEWYDGMLENERHEHPQSV